MFKYGQWVAIKTNLYKVPGVITYVHPGPKEPKYGVDIGAGKEWQCRTDELEPFNMSYCINLPEEDEHGQG